MTSAERPFAAMASTMRARSRAGLTGFGDGLLLAFARSFMVCNLGHPPAGGKPLRGLLRGQSFSTKKLKTAPPSNPLICRG
jgi:hypothetical protein